MRMLLSVLPFFCFFALKYSNAQPLDSLKSDSLYQVGQRYMNLSIEVFERDLDSCLYYTELAKDVFEAAGHWKEHVDMISGVSGVYYYKKDFEQSLEYNELAIQAAQKYLGKESPSYGYTLNTRGLLLRELGDYEGAVKFLTEALRIAEQAKQTKENLSVAFHNLGLIYSRMGDLDQAIQYYREGLKLRVEAVGEEDIEIPRKYFAIGKCYKRKGDLTTATSYFEKAVAKLEGKPNSKIVRDIWIDVYHGLAEIHLERSRLGKAVFLAKKALALEEEGALYRGHTIYQLLGQIALAKKNFPQALEAFYTARTLAFQKRKNSLRHPDKAQSEAYLADVFVQMNALDSALVHYQRALILGSTMSKNESPEANPAVSELLSKVDALRFLRAKGQLLCRRFEQAGKESDLLQALDVYKLLSQLIIEMRENFLAEDSKLLLAATATDIYEEGIELAIKLYERTKKPVHLEQAFIFAEGNKASLLLDAARDNLARDNSGIQDSLLLQESRLKSKMAFYERKIAEARLMPEPGQEETLEGWERELFRLRTQFAELTKAMETSFPKYHQLKYTRGRVTVDDIRQSVLDDQSLLVEFFMGKERLYVFYLSEESLRWKVIEQPADLVAQISRLRDIVSSRPDSESFVENCQTYGRLAAVLYSELLADGVQMATGLSRLLIVPDDALNFLPFELLLTEAPEADVQDYRGSAMDYLFRRFRVSYNYSASLLVVNRQREFTERRESFLGMAPSFGSSIAAERACDREEQYNLRCNVPEVEHIHNILGGKMFRNVEANKEAFIRESGDYRVIHLATHACLDENDAMLSKIFFSDGDLSIYELSKMDLQADLIVLSACNTNTGILLKGEGVASVARGFSLAGCASSLTSLWSVDDCATSEMMQFYYDELGEGRSKDEAIQRAKLSYLAQADKASSHPYFWSAFVQLGDTKPLEAGRTWWQFLLYFLPFTALPILALLLLKMVFNRKSATVS